MKLILTLFLGVLILAAAGVALAATATLQWDAPTVTATNGAATGYKIYKGTASTCTQTGPLTGLLATLGTVLAYTDAAGLTAGLTICYEVTATNAGGESAHSIRVTGVVPTNPPLAPLNPRLNVAP